MRIDDRRLISLGLMLALSLGGSGCVGQAMHPERDQAGYEPGKLDGVTLMLDVLVAPIVLPIAFTIGLLVGGPAIVIKELTHGIWKAKRRDYEREAQKAVGLDK